MNRKDKKQVIGEPMTDEQIRAFLDVQPEAGESADYHALLRAYRSLRVDDFARFLHFFHSSGRNLLATDTKGRPFTDLLAQHRQGAEYLHVMKSMPKDRP